MEELKQTIRNYMEAANYQFRNGFWFKGRGTATQSDDKIIAGLTSDVKDNNTRNSIIAVIRSIEGDLEVEGAEDDSDDDAEAVRRECEDWSHAYKRLCDSRWSEVDDNIWSGMYYTLDQDGDKIVVARVSPSSKELRIVGKTDSEIAGAMCGVFVDTARKITRHKYIDDMLTECIINHCTARMPGVLTPIEHLDGNRMPASVANVLYTPLARNDDQTPPVQRGWTLEIKTANAFYPTVQSYIKHSLSAFLAQESKYIEEIKNVTDDPDEYAYNYIELSKYKEGPTLNWDKWGYHSFNSKEEYECFCAWVGSIFIPENTSKQACWLHGAGNMGLSKVQNAIYKELGKYAVASFSGPSSMEGQFVNSQVVGKRLVVISDSKNENHIRKGIVHNWTGGDVILINRKNKQAYSMSIYLKAMICENIPPAINFEQDNQMSRLLYFKMKIRTEEEKIKMGIGKIENGVFVEVGSANFQEELDTQVNAWIHKCIKLYRIHCPNNAQIVPYNHHTAEVISRCADYKSEMIYDWLNDNIIPDKEASLLQSDLLSAIKGLGLSTDDGHMVQALNLMLEKYFQTSAVKTESRKKAYPRIKLKTWTGAGDSSFKLVESKSESQQLHDKYINTEWVDK